MGTTRKPEGLGDARSLLQGNDAPVRYDVSRGLARHQQLVADAAPLPEWASELAPVTGDALAPSIERRGVRALAKRVWWLGGALLVVGALWLGVRGATHSWPTERVPAALAGRPPQTSTAVASNLRSLDRGRAATPSSGADHTEAARAHMATPDQPLVPRAEPSLPVEGQPLAHASTGAPVDTRPLSTNAAPVVTSTSEQARTAARATNTRRTAAEATPLTTTPADSDKGVHAAAHVSEARAANGVPLASARQKTQVRAESPRDAEEMRQLVEAERLLKAEPVRALRIVREGHVTFRGGYFAQERRYIEVMALFALGRRGEAHSQATWFLRDYPGGPYRHRVESEMLRVPAL